MSSLSDKKITPKNGKPYKDVFHQLLTDYIKQVQICYEAEKPLQEAIRHLQKKLPKQR